MIKKLIIAAVVVILLTGSLVAVDWHYRETTQKNRQAEATAIQKQIAENDKKLSDLQKTVNTRVQTLLTECQKGKAAYDALPAVTKAKVAAPVCQAS